MQLHDVAIRFTSNSLIFGLPYCLSYYTSYTVIVVVVEGISISIPEHPLGLKVNITIISAVAMKLLSRKAGTGPIAQVLFQIKQAIKAKTSKEDWRKQIPTKYNDFLELYNEKWPKDCCRNAPTFILSR